MDLPEDWSEFLEQSGPLVVHWINKTLTFFNDPKDRKLLREVALMAFREGRVYQAKVANEDIDALLAELRRAGNA